MNASNFKLKNEKEIYTISEFAREGLGITRSIYVKITYLGEELTSTSEHKITFKDCIFKEVSFSKTIIRKVKFLHCTFNDCLFLNTTFEDCTFNNCRFSSCNTSGSQWKGNTSIDPNSFKNNFDFIHDANIATKLFSSLIELYINNHQKDREKDSQYLYLKATNNLMHYSYKKKYIDRKTYYYKKTTSYIKDKFSGYGIYKGRILLFLFIYLMIISKINYIFQDYIFAPREIPYSFINSLYFSFITITTIGYGDMVPATQIGQMAIIIESALGIIIIALSLNMFSNEK